MHTHVTRAKMKSDYSKKCFWQFQSSAFFKDDDYLFNGFHLKIFCSILDEQNFCLHFVLHTVTL